MTTALPHRLLVSSERLFGNVLQTQGAKMWMLRRRWVETRD